MLYVPTNTRVYIVILADLCSFLGVGNPSTFFITKFERQVNMSAHWTQREIKTQLIEF